MIFLKGIIVGIGKIIPGVSGSMLAISMGIYEKLLNSINNFFIDIKNNFIFLFKFGLGVLVSIILFSNIILKCLNSFYIVTIFLFIGLIIGSFSDIKKEIKNKSNKIIFISFFITMLLGSLNINSNINLDNYFLNFIYFIVVGMIDAFTMVVPGISGTATLMMIGAYDKLINVYSNLFNISNLLILLPFGIGIIIGTILTVKLVNYLFTSYKDKTYNIIIGFTYSTIVFMGINSFKSEYSLASLIISFIMLIIGFLISKKINHFND